MIYWISLISNLILVTYLSKLDIVYRDTHGLAKILIMWIPSIIGGIYLYDFTIEFFIRFFYMFLIEYLIKLILDEKIVWGSADIVASPMYSIWIPNILLYSAMMLLGVIIVDMKWFKKMIERFYRGDEKDDCQYAPILLGCEIALILSLITEFIIKL